MCIFSWFWNLEDEDVSRSVSSEVSLPDSQMVTFWLRPQSVPPPCAHVPGICASKCLLLIRTPPLEWIRVHLHHLLLTHLKSSL